VKRDPHAVLAALRAEPDFPFDHARRDDLAYARLEVWWVARFRAVLGAQADVYRAWQHPDPSREGDPIFSAIDEPPTRGVLIKQRWSDDAGPYVPAQPYIARYPVSPEAPEPSVPTLVVIADLSDAGIAWCDALLTDWCGKALSERAMRRRCRECEEALKMPRAPGTRRRP